MKTTITRRAALAALAAGAAAGFLRPRAATGRPLRNATPQAAGGSTASAGDASLHYLSLREAARRIENREISSVELTEALLDRIAAVDGRLKSYATVMADQARAAADEADREIAAGNYRGPLHGVPIAVKDLCYTRGVRTMGATPVLADFVPDYDATVVARLSGAGAVLLGKLNLTEGAMAAYHPDFDIPVNPWDEGLWPGASSSGSGVATAAGLCFGSLGSDTGGSIRFPSAQCGIVGIKPTWGLVSRYGVLELAGSLDHVGPMTRTVADAAIMLEAIAGEDPNDPTSLPGPAPRLLDALDGGVAGLRLGYDRRYATVGVDPAVAAGVEEALGVLTELGAEAVEVEVPGASVDDWGTICAYEAVRAHADHYPVRASEYGAYFGEFLASGAAVTDGEYAAAMERRADFAARYEALLGTVDALVCPSTTTPMPVLDGMAYEGTEEFGAALASIGQRFDPPLAGIQQFTAPADFAGTPTISVPCGFNAAGAPLGLQLVGRDRSEATLCRLAHAYEQATEWHRRHPDV